MNFFLFVDLGKIIKTTAGMVSAAGDLRQCMQEFETCMHVSAAEQTQLCTSKRFHGTLSKKWAEDSTVLAGGGTDHKIV